MPMVPLHFPAGIVRPGTEYKARGRWYDCTLVRWFEGVMQPWGGWSLLFDAGTAVRGMFCYNDSTAGTSRDIIVVGTATTVKYFDGGLVVDITPAGFVGDRWHFDNFGNVLLGAPVSAGGSLYESTTGSAMAAVAAAPGNIIGMAVTPERIVVVIDRDNLVSWSDQEDYTTWTPTTTNQAGDFPLSSAGRGMLIRRARSETLIWTSTDLWTMRYIGGGLVYSFQQLGSHCGLMSQLGAVVVGTKAFWMGERSFFAYDGFVRPLPCAVSDYVFPSINRTHENKVCCYSRAEFGEVVWHFPKDAATENSHYVAYDYIGDTWSVGALPRSMGIDQGPWPYPIAADNSGKVYEHEKGTVYQDSGATALVPFAESGPLELGEGDRTMMIRQFVPDEETLGDVDVYLMTAFYPNATETSNGPYTPANPTDVRLTARQVRLKVVQDQTGWRLGVPRLEVVPGGKR